MTGSCNILGISAFYHDSAACLIRDGDIIAAAQEERFTRKKHDAAFPNHAIAYCLAEGGIELSDVNYVTFYDKPLIKFERLLETYLSYAPRGFRSFVVGIPAWLKGKLFLKVTLKRELSQLSGIEQAQLPPLLFNEHHASHAASAFYPSPYEKAAVLCLDGVGEWASSSVWLGEGNRLTPQWEIQFPHSLGLLYSAFTYFTGFKVNSGEYKLMGLAPYGQPIHVDRIVNNLIDIKEDGTFRLNMSYFAFATGLTMTNRRFEALFDGPARQPESPITQREMDLAASIQQVTEDIVLKLAQSIHSDLQVDSLCLAGGVALNCVANGRLLREGPFANIWIQPAAGDAGGALGAALGTWYEYLDHPRRHSDIPAEAAVCDAMSGTYLGPAYSGSEEKRILDAIGAHYEHQEDDVLLPNVAELLEQGNVIGWFNGRMEFGPRALGARSILGDPRHDSMQSVMNFKIKHRESFRPFAPAIKFDKVSEWFNHTTSSPYMLMVAPVAAAKRLTSDDEQPQTGLEQLKTKRSQIPAVTHVDCSARLQTVHPETNPRFYQLLDHFDARTGCPVLINTSFNVRGEPIVCSPEDAYRCFMRTEMDYLVIDNLLLSKAGQPEWHEELDWRTTFELD